MFKNMNHTQTKNIKAIQIICEYISGILVSLIIVDREFTKEKKEKQHPNLPF